MKRSPTSCTCPMCQQRRLSKSLTLKQQRELLRYADSLATDNSSLVRRCTEYWNRSWYTRIFRPHRMTRIGHTYALDYSGDLGCDYERWAEKHCGPRKPVLVVDTPLLATPRAETRAA